MDIAKNIQEFRKRMNLSQEDLAEYLGVKREMISYYENGSRPIAMDKLIKLSDLYVVEISDLIITQERDNNPLNTLTYETMSIEVKITPVKYRNVEWMKETKFSSIPVLLSPPTTFIKKLKFLCGRDNAY